MVFNFDDDQQFQDPGITDRGRALVYFTDRRDLCEWFVYALNFDPAPGKILFLKGDGGNGKSLLLDYLASRLAKRSTRDNWDYILNNDQDLIEQMVDAAGTEAIPVARVTFAVPNQRSAIEALSLLRSQLVDEAGEAIPMPLFDFAMLTYLKKANLLDDARIRSTFPGSSAMFATAVAGCFSTDPTFGLIGGVLGIAEKTLGAAFRRYQLRRRLTTEDLLEISLLQHETHLAPRLVDFFAADLNLTVTAAAHPSRIVLMFDTHEALVGQASVRHGSLFWNQDAWLRRLLVQIDRRAGVITIVAGRDRPRWYEPEAADDRRITEDDIEVRDVSDFSDRDADDFLRKVGVTDAALRERFLEEARSGVDDEGNRLVHPLYIGLNADLFHAAAARKEALDESALALDSDLGRRRSRLFDRLLRYLGDSQRRAIIAVSHCRWFDYDVYRHLGQTLGWQDNFSVSDGSDFERLMSYSFVRHDPTAPIDDPRLETHQLLQRITREDPAHDQRRRRIHTVLEAYWRERAKSTRELSPNLEAIFHANHLDWKRSCDEWLMRFRDARIESRGHVCRALIQLRNVMAVRQDDVAAGMMVEEGKYYSRWAQYDQARASLLDALELYDRLARDASFGPVAHRGRGNVYRLLVEVEIEANDYKRAERFCQLGILAFDESLTHGEDSAGVHSDRGVILQRRADIATMQKHFDIASIMKSSEVVRNFSSLAEGAFNRALEIDPLAEYAYTNLENALQLRAFLEQRMGDTDNSLRSCQAALLALDRAIAIDPNAIYAHNTRGITLTFVGDLYQKTYTDNEELARSSYEDAVATYRQGIAISPTSVFIHNNLGLAFLSWGELEVRLRPSGAAALPICDEAIKAFDSALAVAPGHPLLLRNRQRAVDYARRLEGG